MPVNKKLKRKNMIQALILICLVVIGIFLVRTFSGKSDAVVRIITDQGIVEFQVEVADTAGKKAFGLMHRRNLPLTAGMLFVYDSEGYYSFWMKNTYIPLDIIFISKDNVVVDIYENAQPHSTDSIVSKAEFKYALEINGGLSHKHSIKPGNRVEILFAK